MYVNEFQLSFLGMVMYDDEFKTLENKIKTKDKIEPQHSQQQPASKCIQTTSCEQEAGGIAFIIILSTWCSNPLLSVIHSLYISYGIISP